MKTKPETQLSREIQDALKNVCGAWVLRINSGGRSRRTQLAPAGTPDLYVVGLGWLECKRPGERLNPEQINWHARAKAHGERVAVVTSVKQAVELVRGWREDRDYARAMGWL